MPGDPQLSYLRRLNCPHGNAFRCRVVTQGAHTFALVTTYETVYALNVVNLDDPLNPAVVNQVGWGDLDGTATAKESGFVTGLEVNAAGTRAYVGIGVGAQVRALDISALPAVTNVGGGTTLLQWTGTGSASASYLSRDGTTLFAGISGLGLVALDISNTAAITLIASIPITGDSGGHLPISNVVTVGTQHVIAVRPADSTVVLVDITNPAAMTALSTTSTAPVGTIYRGVWLTPTRMYTSEGNTSPPAGINATNRSTLYIRSIAAAEGGSLASPLLIGQSGAQEAELADLLEITRVGRRYIVATCRKALAAQTVGGTANAFSGRTLILFDVESPASISAVAVTGPQFGGGLIDHANPPYESYATIPFGNYLLTTSYNYGLMVADASVIANTHQVSRALLSGESRHLAKRGNLLAIADAISTLRFYDVTDPENPVFQGNYFSASQCFQYCAALPAGAPGYAYCGFVTSGFLETVNCQDPTAPSFVNALAVPFSLFGMDGNRDGSPSMVVWGHTATGTAWALVDLTNPAVPVILSSRLTDAQGSVRCSRCVLDGNILYFGTWGTATGNTVSNGGVFIYDVTNKAAPVLIASITNGPILIADMAIITSGARKFLVTCPRWDAAPTATVLARGGIWVYEVTNPAAPVFVSNITHTALLGGSNLAMIGCGLSPLPGFLIMGNYYGGIQPLDSSNAATVTRLPAGQYTAKTTLTFSTLTTGADLYALTISNLQIYRSAALGPPTPPAPVTVQFYFSEAANAGSVGAEALSNAWMEVRTPDGITLLAEAAGSALLNLGEGFYGAPSLPWPAGQQAVMTRFHPGTTPDAPLQRTRNLIDFAGAID